MITRFF